MSKPEASANANDASDTPAIMRYDIDRYSIRPSDTGEFVRFTDHERDITAANAKVERYREALSRIEDFTNGYGDIAGIVHKIAWDARQDD